MPPATAPGLPARVVAALVVADAVVQGAESTEGVTDERVCAGRVAYQSSGLTVPPTPTHGRP